MANTLNDYYAQQGQALPSLEQRQGVAQQAGITGYTGTAEQNNTLLGYLKNLPNQSGNNVITSDNLTPEKPVQIKPQTPDTSAVGLSSSISSLVDSTKNQISQDQTNYDAQTKALAEAMKVSGDTSAYDAQVIKEQGVDTAKKTRDTFMSQIEAEQKSAQDQINQTRQNWTGTTAGLNAEVARIQRESANKLANYGIGLSAASRDYETASNIADRLITANSNKLKADVESRKFVLEQLGTKLATEKATSLQLQLKQIDREDSIYKDAIKYAQDSSTAGIVDGTTAYGALSDLTSGKISLSEFYTRLGATDSTAGNINGYDITSYATDPQHEVKVQSIYDNLQNVTDTSTADEVIKSLSPNSPITGKMVIDSAQKYGVDPKLMIALMQQDSGLGTQGLAVKTKNAGNVGNTDSGATHTFDSWNDGVDAVAKWLSNHKSTGVYRGEFNNTISIAKDFLPTKTQAKFVNDVKNFISSGDYKSAYLKLENAVSTSLTGDNKVQFDKDRASLPAIEDLKAKLQAYSDAGGQTGLLKGTYENILGKLGSVADPKFKTLATDLKASLQRYRHDISGAAFSAQEAADYASVNPLGTNKLDLNLSLLDGLYQSRKRSVDSTVDSKVGDGAQYIRQYAETGTTPQSSQTTPTWTSTPSGNSFRIIQGK